MNFNLDIDFNVLGSYSKAFNNALHSYRVIDNFNFVYNIPPSII